MPLLLKLCFNHLADMRSRYKVCELQAAHFVTSTIVEWLPVFTTSECCDILVDSPAFCRANKGLLIHAWVIMDNHFHAVVSEPELSATLRDFKKFTARQLLKQIRAERRAWLLNQLEFYRLPTKIHSDHQVWQEGSHPQALLTDEMLEQKIGYIHQNPVARGWVVNPEDWRYSSAHEWRTDAPKPLLACDPWR